MFELLAPVISVAANGLLILSGLRASRFENRFLKWGVSSIAALLSVVVTAISVLLIVGLIKLHARNAPVVTLNVSGTPEQIQRGEEISNGFCSACHSTTGTLTGGKNIADDLPVRIGAFVSSNLTPAGSLVGWRSSARYATALIAMATG